MSEKVDKKEIICVICPSSCRMQAWWDPNTEEVQIEGFKCPRGKVYGTQEYTNPTRMLITTMKIVGGTYPVIPVHSEGEIPKNAIFDAMTIVNDTYCRAPVKMDDILIENILGTGKNVLASRDMDKIEGKEDDEARFGNQIEKILKSVFFSGKTELGQNEYKMIEKAKEQILDNVQEYGCKFF